MHVYKPLQKSTRSSACLVQHTIGKTLVVLAMRFKRCTSAWSAADMFVEGLRRFPWDKLQLSAGQAAHAAHIFPITHFSRNTFHD